MKVLLKSILILFVVFSNHHVVSARTSDIVAIVDDEAILYSDLNHRISLTIRMANMEDTQQIRQQLKEQLLNTMINEALMRQVAEQYKIEISEQEVHEMLDNIANQSRMSPAGLRNLIKELGISKELLVNQIKAQLGWRKYITAKFQDNIQITDEDINLYKKAVQREQAEDRFHLQEIVISFGEDRERALKHAREVCQQLDNGAHFGSIAQQVSSAASALKGGDLGFVRSSQLAPDILKQVQKLEEGQWSQPIKLGKAYHIVRLEGKRRAGEKERETLLTFMQAILPLTPNGTQADLEKLMEAAEQITRRAKTVAVFKSMTQDHPTLKIRTAEKIPLRTVHPDLLSMLLSLEQGQISEPVETPEGIMFFALEKREIIEEPELDENFIRAKLSSERMNSFASMSVRKLRQRAYIEKRL